MVKKEVKRVSGVDHTMKITIEGAQGIGKTTVAHAIQAVLLVLGVSARVVTRVR